MNLPEQFMASLYDFPSYHKLASQGAGKSFLYLFLLFTLFFIIVSVNNISVLYEVVDEITAAIEEEIPEFNITDGLLYIDADMPLKFGDEEFLFVIDTSGNTTENILDNTEGGILLTKDTMFFKSGFQTEKVTYEEMEIGSFNTEDILQYLPALKTILLVFYFFYYFFAFAGKIFGVLLLTVVAVIVTAVYSKQLTFLNQWNVAIYASTVPVLLKTVNTVTGTSLGGWIHLFYWITAIVYVLLAVKNMPEPVEPALEPDDYSQPRGIGI